LESVNGMPKIKLIEKPKQGKKTQREAEFEIGLAEKVLRKSRTWTLPADSKYLFKDGSIIEKSKNVQREETKKK